MSGVDDLVAFCRARLDEAERTASGARGIIPVRRPGDGSGHARPRHVDQQMLDMYVATFKPERMLNRIAADRRIVDDYAEALRIQAGGSETGREEGRRQALELACKAIAALHSDHRDFLEKWQLGRTRA